MTGTYVPGQESHDALPRPEPEATRLRIDWLLNGIEVGSGGVHNILRCAYYLERFGHDVGLQFDVPPTFSVDEINRLIQNHFYPLHGPISIYNGVSRPVDVIFATHWGTVAPALAACPSGGEVMYFVQDFEPFFYSMSSNYILAENTYKVGVYCICAGTWCSYRLKKRYGTAVDHYDYPLDRATYFPRPRKKKETNVVFFARPEMPRRCYSLGVVMLREFHRLMPEVEIILFGSRYIDASSFDFPVTVCGVLPTINDLAQMYADADLGIAFATTNPSLVPYEMMACGLPVVDIGKAGAELNYGNRSDIAFLGNHVPRQMAAQVFSLMANSAERQARSANGLEFVSRLPTAEEMARDVERLILSRLQSRSSSYTKSH